MIRQHKKNDITHINYNAVSDFYRLAIVESITGFAGNTLGNK